MAMQEKPDLGSPIRQKILLEPSPAIGLNTPGSPRNSRTNALIPEAGSLNSTISIRTSSFFQSRQPNFSTLIYHIETQSAKICDALTPG
jgi:hypothetical protein